MPTLSRWFLFLSCCSRCRACGTITALQKCRFRAFVLFGLAYVKIKLTIFACFRVGRGDVLSLGVVRRSRPYSAFFAGWWTSGAIPVSFAQFGPEARPLARKFGVAREPRKQKKHIKKNVRGVRSHTVSRCVSFTTRRPTISESEIMGLP